MFYCITTIKISFQIEKEIMHLKLIENHHYLKRMLSTHLRVKISSSRFKY